MESIDCSSCVLRIPDAREHITSDKEASMDPKKSLQNHPLNAAAKKAIADIVASHKDERGPVIVMLHDIQEKLGYIPYEAMKAISDATGVSTAEVYGVVMFYAQFTTQPKGKHVINICLGTACYVKGGQKLIDQATEMTGCPLNGTSPDGMFSIDATRCIGACGLAPVATVDGNVIGDATNGNKLIKAIKMIQEEESKLAAAGASGDPSANA